MKRDTSTNRPTAPILRGLLLAAAIFQMSSIHAAERGSVQPRSQLLIPEETVEHGDTIARMLGTLRIVDERAVSSGLRVRVMTYEPPAESCPETGEDTERSCHVLMVGGWVELGENAAYALWHGPISHLWTLGPKQVQPKIEERPGEYTRILLRCENSKDRAPDKRAKNRDVGLFGAPYRLHVWYKSVVDEHGGREELHADLDRMPDDAINGQIYTCVGTPMPNMN